MTSRKNKTKNARLRKDTTIHEIAGDLLHCETLEERRSDSPDIHDLSVWAILDALDAAYEAGRKASR